MKKLIRDFLSVLAKWNAELLADSVVVPSIGPDAVRKQKWISKAPLLAAAVAALFVRRSTEVRRITARIATRIILASESNIMYLSLQFSPFISISHLVPFFILCNGSVFPFLHSFLYRSPYSAGHGRRFHVHLRVSCLATATLSCLLTGTRSVLPILCVCNARLGRSRLRLGRLTTQRICSTQ